jgi:alpha-ketoglutarate-dependent taurine dioxygenase
VDKLTPIIGAEIDGVDLAKPLSNRTVDEIHRALAENIVIFFRDQQITHPSGRAARAGRTGVDVYGER